LSSFNRVVNHAAEYKHRGTAFYPCDYGFHDRETWR
jgi:hypothetical protein